MTKLDDLLTKWPMPERSQLEADEAAERIVASVEGGQMPGSLDASLLDAPLPKSDDDEQGSNQTSGPRISRPGAAAGVAVESKMSKDRTRDRTSFQELAKLAQTTPPPPAASSGPHTAPPSASSSGSMGVVRGEEATSSDSGIVDLKAIASADPSGSQRAQTTPLAAQGLFDDESAPPKPAITEKAAEAAVAPAAASAVAQVTPASTPKKAEKPKPSDGKKSGGAVIVIGALVAAAAIAAGGVFYVRSQHTHKDVVATTPTAPDKAQDKTKAATTATPAGTAAVLAQAETESANTDTTTGQTGGAKSSFRFHANMKPGPGQASPTASDNAPPPDAVDPKLVANIPTGGAGGNSGDLSEAMKAAAQGGTGLGQQAQTNEGPKYAPGSVAQRPSQGQVAGAIGGVMPAAKQCLGSDDPVSRATVTLQSDGTVKSVTVTGFAAGKPQEACIKSALSKMKVDPFAEATYPVPVTIRPN